MADLRVVTVMLAEDLVVKEVVAGPPRMEVAHGGGERRTRIKVKA